MSPLAALDSRRRRFLTAWAAALVLGTGVFTLASAAWRTVPHPQPLEELSYYPSGRFLEPATLGHAATAADLAWLRAVQYYGQHRITDNQFVRMGHVFDILTALDPGFVPAYVFGAFALAQEGRDFPAAERLMRKGLAANPTSGELAFQLGFLYYVRPGGRDLRARSRVLRTGRAAAGRAARSRPGSRPSPGRTRGIWRWPTSCGPRSSATRPTSTCARSPSGSGPGSARRWNAAAASRPCGA